MSYFGSLMRQTGLGVTSAQRTQVPGLEVEATELATPVEVAQHAPDAQASPTASPAAQAETVQARVERSPESREEAVPARTAIAQTATSMEVSRSTTARIPARGTGTPARSHERTIERTTAPMPEPVGATEPQRAVKAPEAETRARPPQVTFADVRAWVAAEPAEEPEPEWARPRAGSPVAATERARPRDTADESYSLEIGKIEIVMEAPVAAPPAAPATSPAPDYSWTLASRHYLR